MLFAVRALNFIFTAWFYFCYRFWFIVSRSSGASTEWNGKLLGFLNLILQLPPKNEKQKTINDK
jgi:hypothetical protein